VLQTAAIRWLTAVDEKRFRTHFGLLSLLLLGFLLLRPDRLLLRFRHQPEQLEIAT